MDKIEPSTTAASGAERIRFALAHRCPDRIPVDFGSTFVSGIHVSCVAELRRHFRLEPGPVKVIDPGQMLGEIEGDLKAALDLDTEGVFRRTTRFGFPAADWKPWRMYDGLEVLVPGKFEVTIDDHGGTLLHPQGDRSAPPSARMPDGGYFFDSLVRQDPIDEDRLNPTDNLEEFTLLSDAELDHLENAVKRASATGRAVVASFGGTAFGDVGVLPGAGLKHPKGIRDIEEWYVSIRARRDYIHRVFAGQCEIALQNLACIAARVGPLIDIVNVCGTDFGTQNSSFCSVATFREAWLPYYQQVNGWIHKHTRWKTFKHSCGAVAKFIPSFLEAGFDILNPVQCSAAGMAPAHLKETYGERLVFWGGGVDTQQTLPFGSPDQVREEVLRRCEIFSRAGGFVFNAIHNIQAKTPLCNILAMFEALREFKG